MQKMIKVVLLLFMIIITNIGNAKEGEDIVFIDRVLMSNSLSSISLSPVLPGESIDIFSNNDEIIYYVANIGVINPSKKEYQIELYCIDSDGNIVVEGVIKSSLSDFKYYLEHNLVKGASQTLGLDPKIGGMVKGQIRALENGKKYYIKLYFEKKLIGVTTFRYMLDK